MCLLFIVKFLFPTYGCVTTNNELLIIHDKKLYFLLTQRATLNKLRNKFK